MSDLPSPPFVHIEGIHNFRDLGGYATSLSPSQSVKRFVCYRSALPNLITEDGTASLQKLGVTTVFDLRSDDEVHRHTDLDEQKRRQWGPPFAIPGISVLHVPVFPHHDGNPAALAERYKQYLHGGAGGFARAYKDILTEGAGAFREVFLHIKDKPTEPFLFHCSAGKDRTGVLGMLILKTAGCTDDIVAKEYEHTEIGTAKLRPMLVQHILNNPALNEEDRDAAVRMAGAKREYMAAALKMVEEEFGGVENYLTMRCGLSTEDLAVLRKNLLADVEPIL